MRRAPKPGLRPGYTLLEVMLVLTIMVVAASLGAVSLDRFGGDMKQNAAIDLVRARWAECRGQAIEEGRPYRFAIKIDEGRFRLAPDAPEFWGGSSSAAADDEAPHGGMRPLVVEEDLPEGIRFASGSGLSADSSGWATVVTFLPDATCAEDAEIVFECEGLQPAGLKIRGLTGSVSTFKPSHGGGQ
jgi:prepilin-type N-terminal cleavage/methylation domain-containing protein